MAQSGIRNFSQFVTDTSNVRDVSSKMLLLEEDRTPLYVLTNNAKRKVTAESPRIEWFETADIGMLGAVSNGTTAYVSTATSVAVADVTLFGVNDVVQVAKTAAAGASTQEELVLVTAVSGSTNGTLTITRGFAGSTADTIGATNVLKILGQACTETGSQGTPRNAAKTPKTSGCQIFEWPIQVSRTAASTKLYTGSERAHQQMMGMRRQKIEIENAGLFGRFSETLVADGTSRYTSQGVRSIIATNVTDGGGTLTLGTFLQFSRNAFRYGSTEKLLMAAPIVKEALDYITMNKALTKAEDNVFGVSLKRFVTSNGTWLIANNYNMDGGNSDEALGIDLPSVEFAVLSGNGQNNDTQIIQNYDPTNPKVIKDLVFTQAGWKVWHEARHCRLYNVQAYS